MLLPHDNGSLLLYMLPGPLLPRSIVLNDEEKHRACCLSLLVGVETIATL